MKNCTQTGYIEAANSSSNVQIYNSNITKSDGSAIIGRVGTIVIDGGSVITSGSGNPLYNVGSSNATLKDCTLTTTSTYWGVYNEATVTLGEDDGTIDITKPKIDALNGVKNIYGTFNFYDGIITANKNNTIVGNVAKIATSPEGVDLIITPEESKEKAYVGIPADPVAQIGEDTYPTLEAAIEAVPEGTENTTTIELLKTIYPTKTYTIPQNKNIKLALNGNNINGLIKNNYIFNNKGIFEIAGEKEASLPTVNLTDRVNIGDYGFFVDAAGGLVSNNAGVDSSTASCYIPIDLSSNTKDVILCVDAQVSSESNCDYGYATVVENTGGEISAPAHSVGTGRFIHISNYSSSTYTYTLTAGKKYYLYFGYYKDSRYSAYNDQFTINNIAFRYANGIINTNSAYDIINNTNKLSLNDISINLNASGSSSRYLNIINNTGKLNIKSTKIDGGTNWYLKAINNQGNGNVTADYSTILTSGIANDNSWQYRNLCVYNGGIGDITLNNTNVNSTQPIYNDSTGSITVNSGRLECSSASYYGKVVYNNVQGGTIYLNGPYMRIRGKGSNEGATEGIILNNGKCIMNGGFIEGESAYPSVELNNSSEFELKNGTISLSSGEIAINSSNSKMIMTGGTVSKSSYGDNINNKGTFNFNGGTLKNVGSPSYYSSDNACIENYGTANINGGTVDCTYINGIKNKSGARLYMSDGTINAANGYGIGNEGTVVVTGGSIRGNANYGITNTTNSASLTLGVEGDGVPSKTNPSIYGKNYGVSTGASTFNYYDGIIEGAGNQSISGTVTDQEENYDIIKTTANSRETAVLDRLPVAKIVSTDTPYYTLQDAFDACPDNEAEEVQIVRNIIINSAQQSAVISANKNITLNTAGYEVSAGNANTIIVRGKLTVIDELEEGSTVTTAGVLKNTIDVLISIEDEGQLIMNSGKLMETASKAIISNKSTGRPETINSITENVSIIMNGGTLSNATGSAIYNYGKEVTTETTNDAGETESVTTVVQPGKVQINGGNITSSSNGAGINAVNGKVEIENVTISTTGYGIYVTGENANVVINGGTLATSGYGVYNNSASKNVYAYSGTYGVITNNSTGKIFVGSTNADIAAPVIHSVYNSGTGDIQMDNGSITKTNQGCIQNTGNGTITINGGTYTGGGGSTDIIYGTVENRGGTININGGELKNTYNSASTIDNGYYNNNECIINITGGKLTAVCGASRSDATIFNNATNGKITITGGEITNINGYAIYNNQGNVILGNKDGIIDNDSLKIKSAGDYAVMNVSVQQNVTRTLKYYDGTIEAPINKTIYGTIEDTEDGTEIIYTKDTTEIAKLTTASITPVAYIGETEYYTLASAFEDCGDTQTTIKLNQDVGITSVINISKTQNIILNLNNHRINVYSKFINKGLFEVTDLSEEKSGVICNAVRFLDNSGTFKLSEGKLYEYIFAGGTYSRYSDVRMSNLSMIYNSGNGNIELNGGSIYADFCGIATFYIINSNSTGNIKLGNVKAEMIGRIFTDGTMEKVFVNSSNSNNSEKCNIVIDGLILTDGNGGIGKLASINKNTNLEINSATVSGIDYIAYADSSVNNITINGGNLTGNVYASGGNSAIMNNGTINGTVTLNNISEIKMNNGTVNGNVTMYGSSITINNGTITGTLSVYGNNTNINGGTLNSVNINGAGNTKINNTKTDDVNSLTVGAITVSAANTVTLKDVEATGLLTINNGSANVKMLGGSINNTSGNGVNLTSGTFTLGTRDYPVSITSPSITSSATGVNVSGGRFNFYDGIIKGSTRAISGTVSGLPELYTVQLNDGETEATLGINATFEQVATMNGTYFDSVQQAINAAATTDSTIVMQKDVVLTTGLTVGTGQNITIDLAGHSINATDVAYTITNNGTLTIIDSTLTDTSSTVYSKVENYTGTAIYNAGTLIIGEDDKDSSQAPNVHPIVPTIKGAIYGIENNAETASLSIFDGTIKGGTNPLATAPTTIMVPTGYQLVSGEEQSGDTTLKVMSLQPNN